MKELEEYKKQIKINMIDTIHAVIDGKIKEGELHFCRPNDVIKYFEFIDGEYDSDDFETNGSSWDFWFKVRYDNQQYTISGDGYYQNFMSIEKSEDDY